MKTVVLQSFRESDVPHWIQSCLNSTKQWALDEGWDYEFIGDEFFELAPQWVHKNCVDNIYALTDICRLQWLTNKLLEGYDRVIWLDADVLIFAPSLLDFTKYKNFGFAEELFLRVMRNGETSPKFGINNAVMFFDKNQTVLEKYLNTCLERVEQFPNGKIPRTELGPSMLMKINENSKLNIIKGIGLFSLAIMRDIANEKGYLTKEYAKLSSSTVAAANLCHFQRNACNLIERPKFDQLYNVAVSRLLHTNGSFLT